MRVAKLAVLLMLCVGMSAAAPGAAWAASAAEIDREARAALRQLVEQNPTAKLLSSKAKGVLVFPRIVKGGFMVGGQIGEGALIRDGKTTGYYNSVAASYGLQAGVQTFGYALFLMSEKAIEYLARSEGLELGAGPSYVVVDEGAGKSITSTTLTQDVYAFIFDQKGLMAGIGIQGSKITKIEK